VSSDAGVFLARAADRRLGLLSSFARRLADPRRRASCEHSTLDLLRQRVYGPVQGYEDLNDHATLRDDRAIQAAVERDTQLAHPSTLCRWENRADRRAAWAAHEALADAFVASFRRPPKELVLDFDATDDPVHGQQEGRFFHGYYDGYCFLPLYVFCGSHLLVAYLRPSHIDASHHAWAVLALLVKRLRQAWPKVRIVLRADSGFCRWRMLRWCDAHDVGYVIGVARNTWLEAMAQRSLARAAAAHERSGKPERVFEDLSYAAQTWDRPRRVVLKAEHLSGGPNPRFVVTNLDGDGRDLYERLYCARGDMENRIKEQQLGLFADRTSCHRWWANQWRLLLSGFAYMLVDGIRRLGLQGTELARAQAWTIRLKLLKVGAVVVCNTRRVRLLMSRAFPLQQLFREAALRLSG
jgi:hypothetical protein